ncbi:efflux RND transporter periplasmic adaptor subunit [Vibrio sp. WJH972]
MKKTTKRILTVAIVVALLGGGGAYWYSSKSEPPISFATDIVRKDDIQNTVLANGMLQASKLVSVGSQVSGQILKINPSLGDGVKKGDILAQIDSLTQENELKEAQASLASLRAQYEAKQAEIHQYQQTFNRQKAMFADNASSLSDYESAQSNLAISKAELKQLAAQIDQAIISVDSAKLDLSYTTIIAPMDGTVVYIAVEAGQTVNASQNTPTIVELAELNMMTVKSEISEADVINVEPGQPVEFTILGQPNHNYKATLRAIEPGPTSMDGDDSDMTSDDSDAIYYNGLFDIENPRGKLRIGMTAQVSIIVDQSKDALVIPAQVLQKIPKRGYYRVPILVNDQVEYKEVKVGINNKVNAEIIEGLSEGDEIVLGDSNGSTTVPRRFKRSPMGI